MKEQVKFKYQAQIDELLSLGCQLPARYAPNGMQACRFVFSADEQRNHIPQYVSKPKRMLQDIAKGQPTTSLLALSCFTTADKATTFYTNLRKAFKNVAVAIGDSLSEGRLANEDGARTEIAANGHFDFYEYEGCNLNQSFQITRNLCNDEKD